MAGAHNSFDFDWLVIGSGFGGSVSALRLSEKGYSVGVLECGRRFADHEFPKATADLKRYFWNPRLGMKGIFRLTTFKDVSVVSGCGVGGGSLGYANTLYVPPDAFFEDRQWADMTDWSSALAPHYAEAQRMLGVVENPYEDPADQLLRELGEELGVGDTYKRTPVGIFFGAEGEGGKTVPDPFFDGEGPERTGCRLCGRCMVGCPHGAKNTLVKNYLYLAEKRGAQVTPERTVVDIRPLGATDGSDGYEVESVRSGAWLRKDRRVQRARGVVVSAGPLGTNRLLQLCRTKGSLPRISSRLGELVRTNSESILAVTVPEDYPDDLIKRVAITSSIYPDPHTHIETVTYGDDGDSMHRLNTLLVGDGTRATRPLKLLGQILLHPKRLAQVMFPKHWSRRTIIILVMQTLDNAISLRPHKGPFGTFWLRTEQDPERPMPTFIPIANQAAEWFAKRTGGIAQSAVSEALFNIPTTAHILGGAVIAADPERGVVDAHQRVFGYENLLVCDGSAVPANVGVNPSLTITALAEHAMSHVPRVNAGTSAAYAEPAESTIAAS
ncbi:MAG TPA: GMC family oxidoreductase [Solirubrobacteraceae bacterium]|jgi:cholesterol oxidase|nr:GMC family oxidoreductase [Solirubrobacteraceae bacterium]